MRKRAQRGKLTCLRSKAPIAGKAIFQLRLCPFVSLLLSCPLHTQAPAGFPDLGMMRWVRRLVGMERGTCCCSRRCSNRPGRSWAQMCVDFPARERERGAQRVLVGRVHPLPLPAPACPHLYLRVTAAHYSHSIARCSGVKSAGGHRATNGQGVSTPVTPRRSALHSLPGLTFSSVSSCSSCRLRV